MTTRYATIIEGNEGEEIVSAIAQMEGAAPEPRSNAKVEKVADGVMIGMVRGGPVDSVGGFGFPEGSAGKEGRSPVTAKDAAAPGSKAAEAKEPDGAAKKPAAKKAAKAA